MAECCTERKREKENVGGSKERRKLKVEREGDRGKGINIERDRLADKHTDRQTGRQTDREIDVQIDR